MSADLARIAFISLCWSTGTNRNDDGAVLLAMAAAALHITGQSADYWRKQTRDLRKSLDLANASDLAVIAEDLMAEVPDIALAKAGGESDG